jgi:hypothetical protein
VLLRISYFRTNLQRNELGRVIRWATKFRQYVRAKIAQPPPAPLHNFFYAARASGVLATAARAAEPHRLRDHLRRHCHVNKLEPPFFSLSPEFGAEQQARLAFRDPELTPTDVRSLAAMSQRDNAVCRHRHRRPVCPRQRSRVAGRPLHC